MDCFNRRCNADSRVPVHMENTGRCNQQQRTQALATADGGIAHRFKQRSAGVVGHRQQPVKLGINLGGDLPDSSVQRSHFGLPNGQSITLHRTGACLAVSHRDQE